MDNRREQKLTSFYTWFTKSKLYYGIIVLIIFIYVMMFPIYGFKPLSFEPMINPIMIEKTELIFFIPYISLTLMLFTFALYRNVILYLSTIVFSVCDSLIPFVALVMGSVTDEEIRRIPIVLGSWVIFLIINICVAVYTAKYKKKIYK